MTLLVLVLPLSARAQGVALIPQLRLELEAQQDELAAGYSQAAARSQIQRLFNQQDIQYSERFIDSWARGLSERWSRYEEFFVAHQDLLDAWQAEVDEGRLSQAEAEAILRPALARTALIATRVLGWLQEDLAQLSDRARWTDLAHEIGCCEPLYYQALAEAETAAMVNGGPSPDAIAALRLLPDVPEADQVVEMPTRRSLMEELAARTDALLYSGEATPAIRAALLDEALMILEIFPRSPADEAVMAQLRSELARESQLVFPAAPLLSLARIVEPGPMRELLVSEAEHRMTEMAALMDSSDEAETAPNLALLPMVNMTTQSSNNAPSSMDSMAADPAPEPPAAPAPNVNRLATAQANGTTASEGLIVSGIMTAAPIIEPAQATPDDQAITALQGALNIIDQAEPDFGEASAYAATAEGVLAGTDRMGLIAALVR